MKYVRTQLSDEQIAWLDKWKDDGGRQVPHARVLRLLVSLAMLGRMKQAMKRSDR